MLRSPRLSFILLVLVACHRGDGETAETGLIGETGETGDTATLPSSTVTVQEDLVWDQDISLGSVIYIPEGVSLTVLAGVTVAFQPGAGIVVDGTLTLEGNEDAPVVFTDDYGVSNADYGLKVSGTGDASVINYAHFEGIDVTLAGGATDLIRDDVFKGATLSLVSRTSAFTVQDCSFTGNARDGQTSLSANELSDLTVTGDSFSEGAIGIHFNGLQQGATLTVTDSTFDAMSTAIVVGDQGDYGHIVSLADLKISASTDDAIGLYRSDATLEGVQIDGALGDGLYADALSDITAEDVSVNDTEDTCLHILGTADLGGITATGCGTSGVVFGENAATIHDSTVSDTDAIGIYGASDLTVNDTDVSGTTSYGIYAQDGTLTVSGVTVSTSSSAGITVQRGAMYATDTSVSDVASHGFYGTYGGIVASNVTVDGARGHGIYSYRGDLTIEFGSTGTEVRDVEGSGVYAYDGNLDVTDLTVYDARTYGVYASYGDAKITDTTVSTALSGGIVVVRGDLSISAEATGVKVSDVDGSGVSVNTGNITASDLEVSDVRSNGIYATYGDVTLSDSSVDGAGGVGVYVKSGDLSADKVSVSSVESHGFYVADGDMRLSDGEVTSADGHGVYVNAGNMAIDGLKVTRAGSYGIYLLGGTDGVTAYTGTVTDVEVSKTLSIGISANRSDLDLSDATVSETGSSGVTATNANLTVADVSVSDTEGHGIQVSDGALSLSDCDVHDVRNSAVVVSVGTADIDGLVVSDSDGVGYSASDNGVSIADTWSGYTNTITNSSINDVGASGITGEKMAISYSEVVSPGTYGVVTSSSHSATTITYTDIVDAGYRGVVGISYGDNLTDVSYSNITGAYDWAVLYAQSVDNNYVANNNDAVGADTTNEGTLDGDRDASTTQINGADAITNARSSAVSGTGPR